MALITGVHFPFYKQEPELGDRAHQKLISLFLGGFDHLVSDLTKQNKTCHRWATLNTAQPFTALRPPA